MEDFVKELLEIIKSKDEEIKRLTNLILSKSGYVKEDAVESSTSEYTKIRTGKIHIKDALNKMEQYHRVKPDWSKEAEKASEELNKVEILDLEKT